MFDLSILTSAISRTLNKLESKEPWEVDRAKDQILSYITAFKNLAINMENLTKTEEFAPVEEAPVEEVKETKKLKK